MSRRGADRWWRPSTRRRPPQRARQRPLFTEQELDAQFNVAYSCGEIAERKRWQDDLLDVADAAGVTPLDDRAEQVADEVERWLRDQD